MRAACAIMSFNRPDYLAPVLASIAESRAAAQRPLDLHLFQDGAYNEISKVRRADPAHISGAVSAYRSVFPDAAVHLSQVNLGIALNFDRAERRLFINEEYDLVFFFEDDMAIDPRYIPTLFRLWDAFGADYRIGSMSCYGSNHLTKEADQIARRHELTHLAHFWGFALTRRAYWQRKLWIDRYIDVVRGIDYFEKAKRGPAIQELHVKMGFRPHILSQDMFKLMASHNAGLLNLNIVPVLGRYLGETGVHSTASHYKVARYQETVSYSANAPPPEPVAMSPTLYRTLMDRQRGLIEKTTPK